MRMDRRALNRNTLPFIDLHQERRAEQYRRAALNTKRLTGVAALLLIQGGFLLPTTLQALAYRPKIAGAERELTAADSRLKTVMQANAALDPVLKKWARYQKSQTNRQKMTRNFLAIAQNLPESIYIERFQVDMTDKQTHIQIQGVAAAQTALRDGMTHLTAIPEFDGLRLKETSETTVAKRQEIRFQAEVMRDQ